MISNPVIQWLLEGDISIQYQVFRDLLNSEKPNFRKRISTEGWGKELLSRRLPNGHWGRSFYQPKWTSSHYTLLELKNLDINPLLPEIRQTLDLIIGYEKCADGGIHPISTIKHSDVCLNGMFLNYAAYFGASEGQIESVIDFLISQQMKDGGFNCNSNMKGAIHSSLHTTLSVLEGILEYSRNGYTYRLSELQQMANESVEFILQHRLYKSDKTGEIIDEKFTRFSYPCRWRYDVLRALDYFQDAKITYDRRMDDAIELLLKKRTSERKWLLQAKHPGQTHFDMEIPGRPSRWNTFRAMRIIRNFEFE
ncbi:MAG: hypothetical protein Q8N05_07015 [Bacteroidota bacterium]|nr:hypothetical protein [Bacteroidota bacterium]